MVNRGITYIEILVVLSGIVLIATLSLPQGLQFYRSQVLDDTAHLVAHQINQARVRAIAGKDGEAHGIYIATSSLTAFVGSSYSSRDTSSDSVYHFPLSVESNEVQEIVAEAMTGATPLSTTVTLRTNHAELLVQTNTISAAYVQ